MKIHEYQAKGFLRDRKVPLPDGDLAVTPHEAARIAARIGFPCAIKAQVLVGGRGKAGGIKVVKSEEEAAEAAAKILGMEIKGITVRKVWVEKGVDIQRELYLGFILDRGSRKACLIASAAGGVDIEEVAAKTPEKILKVFIEPELGLLGFQLAAAARFLGIEKEQHRRFYSICQALYDLIMKGDASLIEINPLVVTAGGLMALDAKINFDDNALFRHPDYEDLRDEEGEDPLETRARKRSVNYIKLDGQIGCMVNGAGLAMATMDVVKHYGGSPANFLDVGGGAKPDQVTEALAIITAAPEVNTIFVNIFGGIVRCDRVAKGLIRAIETLNIKLPIIMRLIGTNEDVARDMLKDYPQIEMLPTMSAAAQRAVEVSQR